jgi:hypothetical protein
MVLDKHSNHPVEIIEGASNFVRNKKELSVIEIAGKRR